MCIRDWSCDLCLCGPPHCMHWEDKSMNHRQETPRGGRRIGAAGGATRGQLADPRMTTHAKEMLETLLINLKSDFFFLKRWSSRGYDKRGFQAFWSLSLQFEKKIRWILNCCNKSDGSVSWGQNHLKRRNGCVWPPRRYLEESQPRLEFVRWWLVDRASALQSLKEFCWEEVREI